MTSGYRAIGYRLSALALIAATGTSCRLGTPEEPALTGPSTTGLSLALSASPDLLQRDGRAVSIVTISSYGPTGQLMPNVGVHLDIRVDGFTGGLGTLSQRDVNTGTSGKATVTYTSPLPAPLGQADSATVQLVVTPVGSDHANANSSALEIRLTPANQDGGPSASFVLGPRSPRIGDTILFDASASAPSTGNSIVMYAWDFGDGNASPRVPFLTTTTPTMTHEYNKSGAFTVGLTVLDSAGKRATATFTLIVGS